MSGAICKNGLNAMPPKGMCFDCTDDEYKALIEYMAKPASKRVSHNFIWN